MKYFISIFILSINSFLSASTYAQESIETGIVAHRGFWNCEEAGYAKNSIAALRCAQQAGLWGSEFDVHMTSDEVLIVYHDKRINGKRLAEKLPDFTVQYLGYFKSPKRLARNGIKGISSNHTLLRFNRNRYRQARKHDMSVNTWTVNKEKDINRMLLMGVDLITTDHPLQVREFMKAEGIHENINAHQ